MARKILASGGSNPSLSTIFNIDGPSHDPVFRHGAQGDKISDSRGACRNGIRVHVSTLRGPWPRGIRNAGIADDPEGRSSAT